MRSNEFRGNMMRIESITEYIKGGRGMFTLQSSSGKHITYKITSPKHCEPNKEKPLWVSVLSGDNIFQFLGTVWPSEMKYFHSPKAKPSLNSDSVKGIKWLINHSKQKQNLPIEMKFWHEGVCCRCGRALTHPESIENGIGPVCSHINYK